MLLSSKFDINAYINDMFPDGKAYNIFTIYREFT
jgi:hypothetical protein